MYQCYTIFHFIHSLCNGDSVHKSNYTKHDRSVLCDIDPDLNYYYDNNSIKS